MNGVTGYLKERSSFSEIDWWLACFLDWLLAWSIDWFLDRLFDWLIDWLNERTIDWLIDWLVDGQIGWLTDRPIEGQQTRPNEWTDGPVKYLTDRWNQRMANHSTEYKTDCPVDQLTNRLTDLRPIKNGYPAIERRNIWPVHSPLHMPKDSLRTDQSVDKYQTDWPPGRPSGQYTDWLLNQ